jgi:uncharacterized delta-60 repeat protein
MAVAPDPAFGVGGFWGQALNTPPPAVPTGLYHQYARAVALQPDQRIVVCGRELDELSYGLALVARWDGLGVLDASFGTAGLTVLPFRPSYDNSADALALQPDGKIVAAGTDETGFALARLNPDGSLDPGFGTGGVVTTSFAPVPSAYALGVAVQPGTGLIVAAGYRHLWTSLPSDVLVLAGYQPDGTLDRAFGSNGRVFTFGGRATWGNAIAMFPDGRIVVAGGAATAAGQFFTLFGYDPKGNKDGLFGPGGHVIAPLPAPAEARAVTIDDQWRIVAAGWAGSGGNQRMVIARFDDRGVLDPTFGDSGIAYLRFSGYGAIANAIVARPDGRVVAAGRAQSHPTLFATEFALAGLDPNGQPDNAFGPGGQITTAAPAPPPTPSTDSEVHGLALQNDGRLVVAGWAEPIVPALSVFYQVWEIARYQ